jgi:hypothetical protein
MASKDLIAFLQKNKHSVKRLHESSQGEDLDKNKIDEEDEQNAAADALAALGGKSSDGSKSPDKKTKPEPSQTASDDSQKLKSGDISTDDVIEVLNVIRSGKSFKDEQIHSTLDQYIQSLSDAERVALLSFAKGIASIVSGQVLAKDVKDPSNSPANIVMKKDNTKNTDNKTPAKKVVKIKPNVIVNKHSSAVEKKSAENRLPPTPITPTKK